MTSSSWCGFGESYDMEISDEDAEKSNRQDVIGTSDSLTPASAMPRYRDVEPSIIPGHNESRERRAVAALLLRFSLFFKAARHRTIGL